MTGYRFSVIQAYLLVNMRGFCAFAFINASNVCLFRNAVLYVSINRVCESIPQISAPPHPPHPKEALCLGGQQKTDGACAVIIRSRSAEPGSQCWENGSHCVPAAPEENEEDEVRKQSTFQ